MFYKRDLKLSDHVSIDQIKNPHLQIVAIPHKVKTQLTSRWKN